VSVEWREIGFLGCVFNQEPVQDRPDNQERRGDKENSPGGIHRLYIGGKHFLHDIMKPCNFALRVVLGRVGNGCAPVEREIHTKGNQRAKDGAKNAALPHVEPVGLHFDDRNRAVALEIHVSGVDDGENEHETDVEPVHEHQVGGQAEENVAQR